MGVYKAFSFVGTSLLLAAGLTACEKPRPAETAGDKIERAAEDAGKKMGDAADKVADKLGEEGAKAGAAIDDAAITTRVKAAIFAEPGLRTLQIGVDTVRGVVTLSGSVDSRSDADRARELAAAVAGVKAVENRLVVKSTR